MNAHAAILQALFARRETGQGRDICVSLFDSAADWMNVPLLQYTYAGSVAGRNGVQHPSLAPYGAFRCRDGLELILSIQNDREWISFCREVLLQPTIARDDRFEDNMARLRHRATLDAMIADLFATLDEVDIVARLERADVAHGRLSSVPQAALHPHLRRLAVAVPGGEIIPVIAPAPIVDGVPPTLGSVPSLDQHGSAIRIEFGSAE